MATVSVNLVYKTNKKQVNIELEKTISQIITLAINTFKIQAKDVEAFIKDKKLDPNQKISKIIDSKQKEQASIIFKEKENEALKTNFSKINNDKQSNNHEITANTLKLKITNFPKFTDIYAFIEEDLKKLSKDKYSEEEKNDKNIIINFYKEDDGYKIYDKLQKFKASKASNSKINIMIYLGRSNLKNYVYPKDPKSNVNESYKYNSSLVRPDKHLDISSITCLNNSVSTIGKKNKSISKQSESSKLFNTKSQLSTISQSTSITKKNVLSHIEFKNFDHNTIKYRDIIRNKQQEILDVIHPSLNRITVPYMSEEERRLYEYSKDKQKWIDKKGFKLATSLFAARKLPVISNYVGASPSEPPVNYSFRNVDKKKWVSKKGFKVC